MEIQERRLISIYVFGKRYEVPEGLTIQKAMEFVGYRFIRSCGCRGGICGACLTEYRIPGSYQLKVVLACQALAEPEMQLTLHPFVPMNRASYRLEELRSQPDILGKIYPEIYRCLQCNTCSRVCPMEIQVMEYIAMAIRGDIERVATLSFQCIMCGACTAKCPAEISQPSVALLARRIFGKHFLPIPKSLYQRISEIEEGQYDKILGKLTQMPVEKLMEVYLLREQEPQDGKDWVPKNANFHEAILVDKEVPPNGSI
jgi:Fe-S oxidoreductase